MIQNTAIKVKNVYKDFKLPHLKKNSFKSMFTGVFDRSQKHKSYEAQHALKDISFDIKKGEFFGIVGRNGSGKSTLLKMIAGIYQPTQGSIKIEGKLVPFIELGVGFNPELTGRENVYLNGALLGFSKKEIDGKYKDIVDFAELERFMDQKLKNYSSGMQVRLAFSMAIRAEADILLVDEVLAVGDADFQRKCFEYFKTLKREKKTVVFVSHSMEAIREYCSRAMLIEKSEILGIGSAESIAQHYVRLFTEDPQDKQKQPQNDNRWGNRVVTIESIDVHLTSSSITITEVIKANESIDSPIAGIRIRNNAGQEITGSNTKIERSNLPDLEKGQKLTLEWRMPNILSDGAYIIDPAIVFADEITVCDWWNEATTFKIMRDRRLPYPIDPGFTVHIKGAKTYG